MKITDVKYDEVGNIKEPFSHDAVLADAPSLTDDNIQELREIILDSGSSKNYQNKKIKEWFVRHFDQHSEAEPNGYDGDGNPVQYGFN